MAGETSSGSRLQNMDSRTTAVTFWFKMTADGRVEKAVSARMFSLLSFACWNLVLNIAAVPHASARLVRNITGKQNQSDNAN